MTRISYSEEEDYEGQFALFRANLNRSLAGKKGQAALRDLEAALLALPEKRLVGYHLVKDGDVCATGALVALRRQKKLQMTREEVLAQMAEDVAPICEQCYHQKRSHVGGGVCEKCPDAIQRLRMVYNSMWLGPSLRDSVCQQYVAPDPDTLEEDEDPEGEVEAIAVSEGVPHLVAWAIVEQNDDIGGYRVSETDEERYERVLKWTQKRLRLSPEQQMQMDMP